MPRSQALSLRGKLWAIGSPHSSARSYLIIFPDFLLTLDKRYWNSLTFQKEKNSLMLGTLWQLCLLGYYLPPKVTVNSHVPSSPPWFCCIIFRRKTCSSKSCIRLKNLRPYPKWGTTVTLEKVAHLPCASKDNMCAAKKPFLLWFFLVNIQTFWIKAFRSAWMTLTFLRNQILHAECGIRRNCFITDKITWNILPFWRENSSIL